MLNQGDYNRFSCLYTVCLKATDHLNLKFMIGVSKIKDFGYFELSPMYPDHGKIRSQVKVCVHYS